MYRFLTNLLSIYTDNVSRAPLQSEDSAHKIGTQRGYTAAILLWLKNKMLINKGILAKLHDIILPRHYYFLLEYISHAMHLW